MRRLEMIYALNALAFGWITSFWSKKGGLNIAIAAMFLGLAVVNCALAAPFILHLVGQP